MDYGVFHWVSRIVTDPRRHVQNTFWLLRVQCYLKSVFVWAETGRLFFQLSTAFVTTPTNILSPTVMM